MILRRSSSDTKKFKKDARMYILSQIIMDLALERYYEIC